MNEWIGLLGVALFFVLVWALPCRREEATDE